MTRRMSCSMTIPAVKARTKTVTRRHVDTWKDLKPGDRLTLIEKGMGLAKGEHQVELAEVEIVDVRVEEIGFVLAEDDATAREGLPEMSAAEFVRFWCDGHGYPAMPFTEAMLIECRRIEWRYLDDPTTACDIGGGDPTTDVVPAKHCAKFSAPIMRTIAAVLAEHLPVPGPLLPAPTVLDPFAGVGGVHELQAHGYVTIGVEIEPRWAAAHRDTVVGDATALDFLTGSFDAIVTSPTYGNRMADTYTGARDTCKSCGGAGRRVIANITVGLGQVEPCFPCDGTGFKASTRYTYTVSLGEPLAENNAGAMQWGPAYRALHRAAWAEAARVLRPAGLLVLNISDHYRADRLQGVDLWHANELGRHGFELIDQQPVKTQRSRNGANSELRDSCEWVLVFRRGGATS